MRGKRDERRPMFFAIDVEERIRPDHPLRPIKAAVDAILGEMSPLFDAAYASTGRPSVPPEVLLKALLLQCLYTVRSERALVERMDTDLLFRPRKGSADWTRPSRCSTRPSGGRSHTTDHGWTNTGSRRRSSRRWCGERSTRA